MVLNWHPQKYARQLDMSPSSQIGVVGATTNKFQAVALLMLYEQLEATGLVQFMAEQVQTYKKPLLGICLGMQLLRGSEEGQGAGLHSRMSNVLNCQSHSRCLIWDGTM